MPAHIVKPGEEEHWERAKKIVAGEGGDVKDKWALVTHVFQKIRDAHKAGSPCSDDMLKQEIMEYGATSAGTTGSAKALAIPLAKGALVAISASALAMLKADDPRQMPLFGRDVQVKAHTRKRGGKPVQVKVSKRHVEGTAKPAPAVASGEPGWTTSRQMMDAWEHSEEAKKRDQDPYAHQAAKHKHEAVLQNIGGSGGTLQGHSVVQSHRDAVAYHGKRERELFLAKDAADSSSEAKRLQRKYNAEHEKHATPEHPTDSFHGVAKDAHRHMANLAFDASRAHHQAARFHQRLHEAGLGKEHEHHAENHRNEARTLEAHEKIHRDRAEPADDKAKAKSEMERHAKAGHDAADSYRAHRYDMPNAPSGSNEHRRAQNYHGDLAAHHRHMQAKNESIAESFHAASEAAKRAGEHMPGFPHLAEQADRRAKVHGLAAAAHGHAIQHHKAAEVGKHAVAKEHADSASDAFSDAAESFRKIDSDVGTFDNRSHAQMSEQARSMADAARTAGSRAAEETSRKTVRVTKSTAAHLGLR